MKQYPQIINSLLDTDLYKFTMAWAVIRCFPTTQVKYKFYDRNDIVYPEGFADELNRQIKLMENIKLQEDEYLYLKSLRFLPDIFADFMKGYKFNSSDVTICQTNGHLSIEIEGYMYNTIFWEVPLLSLISELYYKFTNCAPNISYVDDMIYKFVQLKYECKFSDFGTRRRFSFEVQDKLVSLFSELNKSVGYIGEFVGTSNVYLSKKYNIKPIGTVAHEWFMLHGSLYGYKLANKMALDNWSLVYGGDLGTALSDTFTTSAFLEDFDMMHSKLFDGVRQDSGSPYDFANKMVSHYIKNNIDPLTKTIIFSDGLYVNNVLDIKKHCDKIGIKCSFGIGTNFTNDVGHKPLNIVIKLDSVKCNNKWVPAVKLSDSAGKYTGDEKELYNCLYQINNK